MLSTMLTVRTSQKGKGFRSSNHSMNISPPGTVAKITDDGLPEFLLYVYICVNPQNILLRIGLNIWS